MYKPPRFWIVGVLGAVLAGLIFFIPFFSLNKSLDEAGGNVVSGRTTSNVVAYKAKALDYQYKDVENHPWGAEIMREMISLGVLHGYARPAEGGGGAAVTVYYAEPEKPISRAEFVTLMVRALHLPAVSGEVSFTDWEEVPWWARGPAAVLFEKGIVKGYPDKNGGVSFQPDSPVTRAEIAAMVVRALAGENGENEENEENEEDNGESEENNESGKVSPGKTGAEVQALTSSSFKDVKEGDWFYRPVLEANRLGIVEGRTFDTFAPQQEAKRVEVMAVLLRMLEKDASSLPEDEQLTATVRRFYIDLAEVLDGERQSEDLLPYLTAGAELAVKAGGISLLESVPLGEAFADKGYELCVTHPGGKPEVAFKSSWLARVIYKTEVFWHENGGEESGRVESVKVLGGSAKSPSGGGEPLSLKTILTEEFHLCRLGNAWKIYRIETLKSRTRETS